MAQLSQVNRLLQAENELLSQQGADLHQENEELVRRTDRLLERQNLVEQCAESLKLENSNLIQQARAEPLAEASAGRSAQRCAAAAAATRRVRSHSPPAPLMSLSLRS